MTYKQVIDKMNGKEFYSDSFGGEVVRVNGVQINAVDSGRLWLINCKEDVQKIYNDYKISQK